MFHVRPTSFIILSATLVAMTGCGTKDTSVCCARASPPGSSGSQTSSPTSTPVAGTPTASPVAGTPTATPVAGTPTATPVAGTPTATPVAGTPTATPVGVTPTATPVGAPTATPVPTPVPSVQFLVFTPTSLNITGIDSTLSFTVQDQTQNGYAGFYTATSENTSIATVAQGSGFATFVVTSVAAGSTFIDVSSTDGGFNRLPVTVTNSGTVVNTRKAKS